LKIIFSVTEDKGENALLDTRFGRAAGFCLYDEERNVWSWLDNAGNNEAAGGAGVQAGQKVVDTGADVYIGAHPGPKALNVLSACGVKLFEGIQGKTAGDNLAFFREGKLKSL